MSKIKIGLSMLFCLSEPFSSLLKRLHDADVRHIELIDEGLHALNIKRIKALREVAQSCSLELTIHAPFADINIASPNPVLRRTILKRLEKSIIYARQLGCRLWVFHPGLKTGASYFYPGLDWRSNLDSVNALLRVARKHGVKIAIENVPEPFPFLMKTVEDFSRFYNELNEDIGLTFDIGHANINKQIQDFITRFADKIVHIHASDNDGVHDHHLGIGHGTIDWVGVAEAIKQANYSKVIMVESYNHIEESLKNMRRLFS